MSALATLVVSLAVIWWARPYTPLLDEVAARGRRTVGVVTGLEPGQQAVHFRFYAPGLHLGTGKAGGVNPAFTELSVGDSVTVSYLPYDPERSVLGDAAAIKRAQNLRALRGSVAFTVAVLAIALWSWPRTRRMA